MAFQLGGDRKLLTASVSEDAGPPLKSFLFDVEDNRFEAYGKYCPVRCAINQWWTSRRWRMEDTDNVPASISKTDADVSLVSSLAKTHPAEPAPTIT